MGLIAAAALLAGCHRSGEGGRHWYLKKEAHSHAAPWSYSGDTGPDRWGYLSPDYVLAATGHEQSPIDIDPSTAALVDLPDISFEYRDEKAVFVNNGHTLEHEGGPGNWLEFQGVRYRLKQFHFHTPSEHTIDGRHSPMEIHLVHENAAGEVLVAAVLIEPGEASSEMSAAAQQLPSRASTEAELPWTVNPAHLASDRTGYYLYHGSFTTPPCTEGVTWLVKRDPAHYPAEVFARFAAIMGPNNRPVQELNGRVVELKR